MEYFKIGITNNDVRSRYGKTDFNKFVNQEVFHFMKGIDAFEIEQRIIRENQDYLINDEKV